MIVVIYITCIFVFGVVRCGLKRSELNAMRFVERIEFRKRAMNKERLVMARLPQQTNDALRLAEGINANEMRALGELRDGFQSGKSRPHRRDGGRRAGRTSPRKRTRRRALAGTASRSGRGGAIVAGDDDGQAFPAHDDLRGTEHMSRRHERHFHIIEGNGFAVARGLRSFGEVRAIARRHDGECFLRRQNGLMSRPRVIGMAMGNHGARCRPHRIDNEIAGDAAQPGRRGTQEIGWFRHDGGAIMGGRLDGMRPSPSPG